MAKVKPNYPLEEYLLLIEQCESLDGLRVIGSLLDEDRKNRCFEIFEYFDIRLAYTFKMACLTEAAAKRL